MNATDETLRPPAANTRREQPNDRIARATRLLCVVIVPFLAAAFYILYLRPGETLELFAWPIKPSMSARMLAAAYAGGIFFFTRAALSQKWHHIKAGFLPVTAFASAMGIATFLHWDKFTHDHIAFYTWLVLYVTTPFLVLAAYLRNRRADPGTPDTGDLVFNRSIRYGLAAVGLITIVVGTLLFLFPEFMITVWPWSLTPLTARVVGGMFALPGLVGLVMAADPRWSSARITLQSQIFSIAFILLASALSWADFNPSAPATWLFVGSLAFLLVTLPLLYVGMEYRLAATRSKA